jgi:putative hydroxymethylpyrimidine transport system ATP-binding protein
MLYLRIQNLIQAPMQPAPSITIQNVKLEYKNQLLFDNLNLTLPGGKCSCLLGKSGSGKTSLLKMIAGLLPSSGNFQGTILFDNKTSLTSDISYMAQTDLLLPWMNALDNALLGAKLRNTMKDKSLLEKAQKLFKDFDLENAEKKYPHELSGGMRQRVALIRTFLEDKPIVLMDEPFSALDAITRFELQNLAVDLLKNKTVLLITHDPFEALRIADEIFILSGQPSNITFSLSLNTTAPRNLENIELVKYQNILFEALTGDKHEVIA